MLMEKFRFTATNTALDTVALVWACGGGGREPARQARATATTPSIGQWLNAGPADIATSAKPAASDTANRAVKGAVTHPRAALRA